MPWAVIDYILRRQAEATSQIGRLGSNLGIIHKLLLTRFHYGLIDDRSYLYEDIIQLALSLPNESTARDGLSGQFVHALWGNLLHPPVSYLGPEYLYRTADGSFDNTYTFRELGKAGAPYARSVTPLLPIQDRPFPDPGKIFDTLLARSSPRPHPNSVSSSLLHFATIIIHDIFRTDESSGVPINRASSYLDLAPLYGHNQAEQDSVRTRADGLLKRDAFADPRLLAQPPGSAALLVAFSRFHNWVVGELARINEGGRFSGDRQKRDEALFQTGRLITSGLYVNVILNDYLRTILNFNSHPSESNWRLDPRTEYSGQGTPRGIGNHVSAEFNFIYRWHAATSAADEAWLLNFAADALPPNTDVSALSPEDWITLSRQWFQEKVPHDPGERVFGGLTRGRDGGFDDASLVDILTRATDSVASAFGALNTPTAMRAIEMLGIEQGRRWQLCTFNEFRKFFRLQPLQTFEDVNPDKDVARALKDLYGHPDNIELYPGLMCEAAKKVVEPGSGLCPGFTISEAILSDAVALVRGDRFYTNDYSPAALTSWGFAEVESHFDMAGGGVLWRLLTRAFDGSYRANSVYALYPFTTPDRTREVLGRVSPLRDSMELDYGVPGSHVNGKPLNDVNGGKGANGIKKGKKGKKGKKVNGANGTNGNGTNGNGINGNGINGNGVKGANGHGL